MSKRTVQIDVTTSIPVEVAQEALASRAMELLKRELTLAARKTISDFVANGITADLEKLAIKAEKKAIKYSE